MSSLEKKASAKFCSFSNKDTVKFESIHEFLCQFTHDERILLCSTYYHFCGLALVGGNMLYSYIEQRKLFVQLMCLDPENNPMTIFPINELDLLISEGFEFTPISIFKTSFNNRGGKQQLRAAYRVLYRWVKERYYFTVYENEFIELPKPSSANLKELSIFSGLIIDEMIKDTSPLMIKATYEFADIMTDFLNKMEAHIPEQLSFYKIQSLTDIKVQEEKLKVYLTKNSSHKCAAARQLIDIYCDLNRFTEAIELLNYLDETEKEILLGSIFKKREELSYLEAGIPARQEPKRLADLSNQILLEVHAIFLVSGSSSIHFSFSESFEELIVPNFNLTHKILNRLINKGVLYIRPPTLKELKHNLEMGYSYTELPLELNILDYKSPKQFDDALKCELLDRSFDDSLIEILNNKIKLAWLFNGLKLHVNKAGFQFEKISITDEQFNTMRINCINFSSSQLSAIAWTSVNFSAGNIHTLGFDYERFYKKVVERVLFGINNYSPTDFKMKIFSRPKVKYTGLEQVVELIGGGSPEKQYERI